MSLRAILRSGYVRRFHANPDLAHLGDTVAHHHAMTAQILCAVHPGPSAELIRAALHHDCGEMVVGDLPAPFKSANPALARAHAAVEDKARQSMGVQVEVTEEDGRWLRFADRLAAYVHVAQLAPHVLQGDGWPEARQALIVAAETLGEAARLGLLELGVAEVDPPRPSITEMLREEAVRSGLAFADLKGEARRQDIAHARQRVMLRASRAGFSAPQIGRVMGRDHTTVLHGISAALAREDRGEAA